MLNKKKAFFKKETLERKAISLFVVLVLGLFVISGCEKETVGKNNQPQFQLTGNFKENNHVYELGQDEVFIIDKSGEIRVYKKGKDPMTLRGGSYSLNCSPCTCQPESGFQGPCDECDCAETTTQQSPYSINFQCTISDDCAAGCTIGGCQAIEKWNPD